MNIAALSSPTSPSAQSALLTHAEHARAAHLSGAALRTASPVEQRAAVAAQFEAILVRQLLSKTMASMMDSGDSTAGSVYGDLVTDTLAQSLTAGQGLGLGRMIEQQLTPHAPSESSAKAGGLTAAQPKAHS
jgi:Rod binding domain-containing protein